MHSQLECKLRDDWRSHPLYLSSFFEPITFSESGRHWFLQWDASFPSDLTSLSLFLYSYWISSRVVSTDPRWHDVETIRMRPGRVTEGNVRKWLGTHRVIDRNERHRRASSIDSMADADEQNADLQKHCRARERKKRCVTCLLSEQTSAMRASAAIKNWFSRAWSVYSPGLTVASNDEVGSIIADERMCLSAPHGRRRTVSDIKNTEKENFSIEFRIRSK